MRRGVHHALHSYAVPLTSSSILLGVSLSLAAQQPALPKGAQAMSSCGGSQPQSVAAPATRELGDMSTDRPDQSDSTDIVGHGQWQLETGISFEGEHVADVSQRAFAAPLAMMRFGLHPQFEMRASAEGLLSDEVRTTGGRYRETGGSDIQIGAKWKLFERPRRCFLLALEPVLSVPTGSNAFTSGGYDPMLKFIVDRSLPGGFSISANVVLSSDTDAGSRFTKQGTSASFSHALPRAWSGFIEISTTSALTRGGKRAWVVDAGASRPIGNRMQIDVSVGRGLSEAAADWFVGTGFAMRGFLTR